MNITTELRVRTKLREDAMEARAGKCPGDEDYDVLLTGATRVTKLDDRPLCVYLPGVLRGAMTSDVYGVLHELRKITTNNRGKASGTPRFGTGRITAKGNTARTYSANVPSALVGALDPAGQTRYCRLTSWTGSNVPEYEKLHPLLQAVAAQFREHVPGRYATQLAQAQATDPAWVVPGTPFTTITVNNSYPTGTHKDAGDLAAGFSTIATIRRGSYTGGRLVFPQYRIAVDMQDGDLLLMDAHEYHGNTLMHCTCSKRMNGYCALCAAERISVVSYYREKLVTCGTAAAEQRKAEAHYRKA